MQMRNEDDAEGVAGAIESPDVGDAVAAMKKAEAILARDRATVDEIAWAWCTLLDVRAGNDITPREARYQSILSAKEWIEGLGLSSGVANAVPSRARKGVTVRPSRASAVSDVSVDAVRNAAIRQGNEWPEITRESAPAASTPMGNETGGRRHYLAHVFERAIKNINGDTELAAVWNELKEMSLNGSPPLLVSDDAGKLKYIDANGDKTYYNYRALEKWLVRNARKAGRMGQ